MTGFDPTNYQMHPNGPLRPDFIARMFAIKNLKGLSYAALAAPSTLSGAFFHNLMNKGGNVSTQHVAKIVKAVEQLEAGDVTGAGAINACTMVAHGFHLRPQMQVTLTLPSDLNEKEAERLAKFISALPIA
jgi:hypothetical protein